MVTNSVCIHEAVCLAAEAQCPQLSNVRDRGGGRELHYGVGCFFPWYSVAGCIRYQIVTIMGCIRYLIRTRIQSQVLVLPLNCIYDRTLAEILVKYAKYIH